MTYSKNTSKAKDMNDSQRLSEGDLYEVLRCRIYPTSEQSNSMEEWLETLRWLFNRSLAERKDAYKTDKQNITYRQQRDALPALKKKYPQLRNVPSQVTQDCLQRLQEAFKHFFRRVKEKKAGAHIKVGYPKFKKYGRYHSLTFTQVWLRQTKDPNKPEFRDVIRLELDEKKRASLQGENPRTVTGALHLPKLGALKIRVHRNFNWRRAKRVTLKKEADGHWYACICFQLEASEKKGAVTSSGVKKVGVDLGLKYLAVSSDGYYHEHPKWLEKSEQKLKKEQRKLSKKKQGSKNRERQRKKVAKIHQKIANQRKDFLHKLSHWLVSNYDEIIFEDLNIPAMVQDKRFAKSILDAGWGSLIKFVSNKSVKLDHRVVKVDARYTSQDCSSCGKRVPKTLRERIHRCSRCGLVMCRDQNAAVNIKNRAGVGHSEPSVE